MKLRIYPKLDRDSRKAMLRLRNKHGRAVDYNPRIDLLQRLSAELDLSVEDVLMELLEEREYLLKNRNVTP